MPLLRIGNKMAMDFLRDELVEAKLFRSPTSFKNKDPEYNFPYFIIFFLAFVLLGTFVDLNQDIQIMIKKISNALFLLGLFFIGSQFNLKTISELSIKPIIFSITLWLIIIIATLLIFYV